MVVEIVPLLPGKDNIGRNIKELEQHGTRPRSHAQILAIALHTAGVGESRSLATMKKRKKKAK
jgi:hypothetical protein